MNVLFKYFSLIYRCGTLQTGSDCPEAGNRKDEEGNGGQGRQTESRSGYMVQILLRFYLYCFDCALLTIDQELNLVVGLRCAISSTSSVSATLDTVPP